MERERNRNTNAPPPPFYVFPSQVPAAEFLRYVGVLFLVEFALLATWTGVAPPYYR